MKPQEFLSELNDARVVAAIATVEQQTSGEIRVFVDNLSPANGLTEATKQFERLGMTKTRDRNAVLIYFAPRAQQFAVIGDEGIHAKCGQNFWEGIAAEMSPLLKSGKFTEAVIHTVEAIGKVLIAHFPRRPDDTNELPDAVAR